MNSRDWCQEVQGNKPYRFVKSASQALISIHARRSFARFVGPSKLSLSNTGACRANSPCPLFMRSRVKPICRKASSLDGTMSEGMCRARLTYMFSDQPSFDWKLGRWTGRALVSLFQSRSSMILQALLRNSLRGKGQVNLHQNRIKGNSKGHCRSFPNVRIVQLFSHEGFEDPLGDDAGDDIRYDAVK